MAYYNSGYNSGYNSSYNSGYNTGYNSNYNSGYNSSYNSVYNSSYNSGYYGYQDASYHNNPSYNSNSSYLPYIPIDKNIGWGQSVYQTHQRSYGSGNVPLKPLQSRPYDRTNNLVPSQSFSINKPTPTRRSSIAQEFKPNLHQNQNQNSERLASRSYGSDMYNGVHRETLDSRGRFYSRNMFNYNGAVTQMNPYGGTKSTYNAYETSVRTNNSEKDTSGERGPLKELSMNSESARISQFSFANNRPEPRSNQKLYETKQQQYTDKQPYKQQYEYKLQKEHSASRGDPYGSNHRLWANPASKKSNDQKEHLQPKAISSDAKPIKTTNFYHKKSENNDVIAKNNHEEEVELLSKRNGPKKENGKSKIVQNKLVKQKRLSEEKKGEKVAEEKSSKENIEIIIQEVYMPDDLDANRKNSSEEMEELAELERLSLRKAVMKQRLIYEENTNDKAEAEKQRKKSRTKARALLEENDGIMDTINERGNDEVEDNDGNTINEENADKNARNYLAPKTNYRSDETNSDMLLEDDNDDVFISRGNDEFVVDENDEWW